MTIDQLAPILKFVKSACGVRDVTQEQTAAWFKLLGDLPADLVQAAAEQVCLTHEYPTLPPVGAIRKAALELSNPGIPAPKAWEIFLAAVRKFGSGKIESKKINGEWRHDIDCEKDGLASLPPQVARAARAFGWQTLCDTSPEDLPFAQEQFRKAYTGMAEHESKLAIMPPSVRAIAAQAATGMQVDEALGWKRTPAIEGAKP